MSQPIDLDIEGLNENINGTLIGQGSYGIVSRVHWRGRDVAIKRFVKGDLKSFDVEMRNLIKVRHVNIIQCLAYKRSENLIIMEFAEDGSLHQLLHSPRYSNVAYNLAHAIDWSLQCARGVQYLHSITPKSIIHRDLKPLNILLKDNFKTIKICDFGTACPQRSLMTQTQGSVAYMAPEVIKGQRYNEKCDIFSWGIILWELFSRQIPHSTKEVERSESSNDDETNRSTNCTTVGFSPMAILWSIASGNRPKLLKNCPKVFDDLIQACWSDAPDDRPSIHQVVQMMEQYYSIVQDHVTTIDSSLIVPDEYPNSYVSFNEQDARIDHQSSIQKCTYTVAKKRIPDNVDLQPHCEMVKISKDKKSAVLESYINFIPSLEDHVDKPLEVLKLEKLDNEDEQADKENAKYVSTIDTQIDSTNHNECDCLQSDYDTKDPATGCGIGSFLGYPNLVTRMFNPYAQSQTIFYTSDTISDQEAKLSTLTPNNCPQHQSGGGDAYTQIIKKHTAKNHRSEIEINCKLNSSASSTISSSSTSIVNDKKIVLNGHHLTNDEDDEEDDDELASSEEYKLSASLSSFESIDNEQMKKIQDQIAKELPNGQQIKYNIDKKKRGISIRSLKKLLRTKPNDCLRLPSDI